MSGFFTKTYGDFHYLFINNSELSKKERRRKKRGWSSLIGIILVLVQLVLTILFYLKIIKLNMIPSKYLIVVSVFTICILLYNFTSQFTNVRFLGKFFAVIFSMVTLCAYILASDVDRLLSKVTGTSVKTDIVDVIVLKDDTAADISAISGYTFGYNTSASTENVVEAFKNINSDCNKTVKIRTYSTWSELLDTFYENKDIQAIVINDSMMSIIKQEYEDFPDKIKIIKQYQYSERVPADKSTVNVNKEPFVIYVSGISSDDGENVPLSSYALSDVNILAVVNPDTRQVLLVSTPRDSYVTISNSNGKSGKDKLAHAGSYGIDRSIEALSNLYGVEVDYYVKINFDGAVGVVDALGGITINSEVEFTNGDDAAPINYHFVVGDNECDGAKTLAFVRERQAFLLGDMQRGRNQASAISAIIQKATSPAILTKYSSVFNAVSDMFLTNIPSEAISNLVKAQLNDASSWNIQIYSVNGPTGISNLEVTGLHNASVVYPSNDEINTAIKLISMIKNGTPFDVNDYTN